MTAITILLALVVVQLERLRRAAKRGSTRRASQPSVRMLSPELSSSSVYLRHRRRT